MTYSINDGKLVFNCSRLLENYSQRNNEYKWTHPKNSALKMDALSMCNVTATVMALDYVGYKFPKGSYKQPEDNLCKFIMEDKEVLEFYKMKMPAMYNAFERGDTDAYCPNLVHLVLAYGTNKWLGTTAMTFHEALPIPKLLEEVVIYNRPVVMSGTFPYTYASGKQGVLGHINTLVGVVYDMAQVQKYQVNITIPSEMDKLLSLVPAAVIVDDPYGSYLENFKAGTGNDVIMPFSDFVRYYKPLNDVSTKMGHTFKPAAAVV